MTILMAAPLAIQMKIYLKKMPRPARRSIRLTFRLIHGANLEERLEASRVKKQAQDYDFDLDFDLDYDLD